MGVRKNPEKLSLSKLYYNVVPSIVFLVWMNVVCYLGYFKILHLTLCLKQHPRFGWLIIKETGTKSQKYLSNIGICMLVFFF